MTLASVVVIGAGHGGVQVAATLRDEGFAGGIVLLSADPALPYQRPPLSKGFIKAGLDGGELPLRAAQWYADKQIDLRLGVVADRIDLAGRRVVLASGEALRYDHLVLATGAKARSFPVPGAAFDGVLTLRHLEDARALRARLASAHEVLVVGAGFIGLELTATAVAMGKRVHVIELGTRPLGRAVTSEISTFSRDSHAAAGAELVFGTGVAAFEGAAGKVTGATLSDGRRLPADLVLLGVGVVAADDLALASGLACDDGVVVDDHLVTSDPAVSAIGDCARFPSHHAGRPARLESVQNAVDQARCVARRLVGKPAPYRDLPWFWSDQGANKLQIAGLSAGCDAWAMRGDPAAGAFTMFGFREGRLSVVETVNRPADHMIARRLIEARSTLTIEQASDPGFDLKLALKPR